jgi:hypothetical protein
MPDLSDRRASSRQSSAVSSRARCRILHFAKFCFADTGPLNLALAKVCRPWRSRVCGAPFRVRCTLHRARDDKVFKLLADECARSPCGIASSRTLTEFELGKRGQGPAHTCRRPMSRKVDRSSVRRDGSWARGPGRRAGGGAAKSPWLRRDGRAILCAEDFLPDDRSTAACTFGTPSIATCIR